MAKHFQLTDEDVAEVAHAFGLDAVRWEHIAAGDANTSLLLDGGLGRRHVLTVLSERSLDPDRLIGLLEAMDAHGLLVGVPLRTTSGASHVLWRARRAIMKPFIDGECDGEVPAASLAEMGAILARIHLIPPPQGVKDRDMQAFDYGYLEEIAATAPPDYLLWLRESLASTDHVEASDAPRGLVHDDYWPDNLVRTPHGLAVIDWERASTGILVHDVAQMLLANCLDADEGLDMRRAGLLLGGYEGVRPLLPEERGLLGECLLRVAAMISCKRFRRHHVLAPTHPSMIPPSTGSTRRRSAPAGWLGLWTSDCGRDAPLACVPRWPRPWVASPTPPCAVWASLGDDGRGDGLPPCPLALRGRST